MSHESSSAALRKVAVLAATLMLSACSAKGSDATPTTAPTTTAAPTTAAAPTTVGAPTTAAAGLLRCEGVGSASGITFDTALGSCDEARALGRQLASSFYPGAFGDGLEITFVGVCSAIQQQGEVTPMTGGREDIALAAALDYRGVCPGDLSLLTLSVDDP